MLDLAPVRDGASASQALRNTVALATEVERLGYRRYWVGEHHNTPRYATPAPAVLIAAIADATSVIRVGSGGVLLPNHPPLVIAEQFGVLSAFHPGRIDLGVGRAPGADRAAARALRHTGTPDAEEFARQITELSGYFAQPGGARAPGPISAGAAAEHHVPVWLLGSSADSAALAGRLGLRYAFAHHIRPGAAVAALDAYRGAFRPSRGLATPYALVSALLVTAGSDREAEAITASHLRAYGSEPSRFTDLAGQQIIGGPESLRQKVAGLVAATCADELMAVTLVPGYRDRLASYRRLREAIAGATGISRFLPGSPGRWRSLVR